MALCLVGMVCSLVCAYTTTARSTNFLLLLNVVAAPMLLLHNTVLQANRHTVMTLGCHRSATTARSVAQDAHGKAGDFGDSAGRAAAEARESVKQTGRDTTRKGAQGTRWAAEEVHDGASSVGQSVGQSLCYSSYDHALSRGLGKHMLVPSLL